MKLLKLGLLVVAAILVIGWLIQGIKLLLWIGIAATAGYFALQAIGSNDTPNEV